MDRNQADVPAAQLGANAVDSAAALGERDGWRRSVHGWRRSVGTLAQEGGVDGAGPCGEWRRSVLG